MKSLWNDKEAKPFLKDPLSLRVYTSRLLGCEPDLVLHGGGNTSIKTSEKDLFGEHEELLYIKGSGWDLATIERQGFAPVKLDVLKKMAGLRELSDSDMVKFQRAAMTNPNAPTPSVEAILHAIIPFRYVDHTHADSVVTITNTPDGEKRIRKLYGERMIYVPYVMPGFILAKKVYEMTRDIDWEKYEGMILLHHGVFTFHDNARQSYEKMIRIVNEAEKYIHKHAGKINSKKIKRECDSLKLAAIRREISRTKGAAMLVRLEDSPQDIRFADLPGVEGIASRGPLTPDHVIRTKPKAAIIGMRPEQDIKRFAEGYRKYFNRHARDGLTCLDPAPRWLVWKKQGILLAGQNVKDISVIRDIVEHTARAITLAERMGGWKALPEKDIFDIEYWELEQAKLKKAGSVPPFQGKVVLVTGAASGIGRACVLKFHQEGACVVALDIDPRIKEMFPGEGILGCVCDVTDEKDIERSLRRCVKTFGGLDTVVSNAGIFPPGEHIEKLKAEVWERSLKINLSSHEKLLKLSIPYLALGLDPSVVIMASKNVTAPGPGAAAYSVAKAGLTQLARVAALELAKKGIRVNVIHPNQVFDTAIWTKEVLSNRARHYGMTVEEYKTSNLLKVEITSYDVAELVCTMAGPVFGKTTGAQIPIDGGNDRVI